MIKSAALAWPALSRSNTSTGASLDNCGRLGSRRIWSARVERPEPGCPIIARRTPRKAWSRSGRKSASRNVRPKVGQGIDSVHIAPLAISAKRKKMLAAPASFFTWIEITLRICRAAANGPVPAAGYPYGGWGPACRSHSWSRRTWSPCQSGPYPPPAGRELMPAMAAQFGRCGVVAGDYQHTGFQVQQDR